jgi:hypothetical protein
MTVLLCRFTRTVDSFSRSRQRLDWKRPWCLNRCPPNSKPWCDTSKREDTQSDQTPVLEAATNAYCKAECRQRISEETQNSKSAIILVEWNDNTVSCIAKRCLMALKALQGRQRHRSVNVESGIGLFYEFLALIFAYSCYTICNQPTILHDKKNFQSS